MTRGERVAYPIFLVARAHPPNPVSMSRRLHSPAERLLFDLCRLSSRPEAVEPLLSDGGVRTLRHLEALAIRHGVQGLVWSRLVDALPDDDSAEEVRSIAEAGLSRLRRQTTFRDIEQDRVLEALADAGIEPLVLKGGALRRTVFTPLERTMGDLDILVEPHAVEPVLGILNDLGYRSEYPDEARPALRRHHHEEELAHPMGFLAEVHWGLTRPRNSIQLDPDRFRARSLVARRAGSRPMRIPCPEDMLVHTVSQMEQESLSGLRRVVDLDRIARVPGLDWSDVRRHADEAGLGGFLCVAARLAHLLLGTDAPDDLLHGSSLSPGARRAVDALEPVRRLLDEPTALATLEFHIFRLWCMDDLHRRRWVAEALAGDGDPLHWVWEGHDAPEGADSEGTTGPLFLLKLAAYQSMVTFRSSWKQIRNAGDSEPAFWCLE